jgi:hypothetical protein
MIERHYIIFSTLCLAATGHLQSLANGCNGSRLCENTCAVLKSALLRKIFQRLVYQQPENLRRIAIFARVLAANPA